MFDEYKCPDEFQCPITQEILKEPYIDRCGHTFEKTAIETWLQKSDECPLGREKLTINDLSPNLVLKSLIKKFEEYLQKKKFYEEILQETKKLKSHVEEKYNLTLDIQNINKAGRKLIEEKKQVEKRLTEIVTKLDDLKKQKEQKVKAFEKYGHIHLDNEMKGIQEKISKFSKLHDDAENDINTLKTEYKAVENIIQQYKCLFKKQVNGEAKNENNKIQVPAKRIPLPPRLSPLKDRKEKKPLPPLPPLFKKMKRPSISNDKPVVQPSVQPNDQSNDDDNWANFDNANFEDSNEQYSQDVLKQLEFLKDAGFKNHTLCLNLLKEHGGDLETVIREYMKYER